MSDTTFFWQGGRKIHIKKDSAAITIQAGSEAEAQDAADRAGVELRSLRAATPQLIRAAVAPGVDATVDKLRAQNAVVHHVYRDTSQPEGDEYLITESFFLKFKPDTPDNRMREYLGEEGLVVERDMGNKTFLVRVTDSTGKNPIRAANAAHEHSDVEYAEPNLVRPLMRFFTPSDDLFATQWHLHAPAAAQDLEPGAGIFAPDAWDVTRGRRDIVIAVADDGFDLTHPDFQGDGKVVARLNARPRGGENNAAIDWDLDVQPRPGDYHGTPCLGVAVAEGNGHGVVGVAPGCSLVAVRFPLQEMTDAHFIVMFEKISSMADVVSCSWGVGPSNSPMSMALREAITRLGTHGGRRGKGLVFCIAAGNNNCPVHDPSNHRPYSFRTAVGMRTHIGPVDRWVANHPDAIIVSASTSRKTRSAYSSWGKPVTVCAPSDNWDDLSPNILPGLGIVTTDNERAGANSDFTPNSRFTDRFGGTSSATPTVAGVCALVLSANDTLSAKRVKEIVQSTADKSMSMQSDNHVNEAGNFDANGYSVWFGHGKVNAFKAVQTAHQATMEQRTIDLEASPAAAIADFHAPTLSSIEMPEDGKLDDIRVQVDIRHTYIGDLRVDLLAPDGSAVNLHNNTGGSTDDIGKTYSPQNTSAMRGLLGRNVRGVWKLRVVDSFRLDEGTLEHWRIVAKISSP